MSPLLAAATPLATLLFFSGFATAQIFAPDCSLTWKWTFNSLGQNACTVAAYMMSTCNGGTFTVNALTPGYSYMGPSGIDDTNLCKCNTVTYSLISACDACQGAEWISWSEYSTNCTTTLPPSTFPNPVPAGTRVPQWALLDITSGNDWNVNKSFAVGDTPERVPGDLLGSGATGSASATRSGATSTPKGVTSSSGSTVQPTSDSSPASKSSSSSSNTGAIVGGAVGGVAVIALGAIAILFFMRRRRPEAPASGPAAPSVFGASQPRMEEVQQPLTMDDSYNASIPGTIGSMPGTPGAPMRIYDPNDPTTFPGYQGIPQTPTSPPQGTVSSFSGYQGVPQTPVSPLQGAAPPSFSGTGNSLATMQTSRGYHGLPTV